jgi:hypothetical protein
MDRIRKLNVIHPPLKLQENFTNILMKREKLLSNFNKENEQLHSLLNKKMDEYFGGDANA